MYESHMIYTKLIPYVLNFNLFRYSSFLNLTHFIASRQMYKLNKEQTI